ncbi:unnamed protein product, partial [Amoebophrya sp. A25]
VFLKKSFYPTPEQSDNKNINEQLSLKKTKVTQYVRRIEPPSSRRSSDAAPSSPPSPIVWRETKFDYAFLRYSL